MGESGRDQIWWTAIAHDMHVPLHDIACGLDGGTTICRGNSQFQLNVLPFPNQRLTVDEDAELEVLRWAIFGLPPMFNPYEVSPSGKLVHGKKRDWLTNAVHYYIARVGSIGLFEARSQRARWRTPPPLPV